MEVSASRRWSSWWISKLLRNMRLFVHDLRYANPHDSRLFELMVAEAFVGSRMADIYMSAQELSWLTSASWPNSRQMSTKTSARISRSNNHDWSLADVRLITWLVQTQQWISIMQRFQLTWDAGHQLDEKTATFCSLHIDLGFCINIVLES